MLRDAGLRLLVLVVGSTVQHASADAVLDGFRTLDYKASSFQKAQVRFSSMRQIAGRVGAQFPRVCA